jgi:hypothetical protein
VGLPCFGLCIRLFNAAGDDLGLAHAPAPLAPGDLVARQQGQPLRVKAVVDLGPEGVVDALAEVEPELIYTFDD